MKLGVSVERKKTKMNKLIYLDNAATTQVDERVVEEMIPFFTNQYGNPSSPYEFGYMARVHIDESKRKIAKLINSNTEEIYFTSGGSESNNWVIRSLGTPGTHIITSKIEHHSVLRVCEYLENCGVEITYLDVDENGLVNPADIESAIRPNTTLISIMYANNEVGTIQPIQQICEIAHSHNILFHTDATQALGHIPIDVENFRIDLLSASAHKLNGPKGVGLLYIHRSVDEIIPLIYGGAQQDHLRAGTENVPGIVGFGKAAELARLEFNERFRKCKRLSHYFINRVTTEIPDVVVNAENVERLPGTINLCFGGIRGEALLRLLEMDGICVSTGSACDSSSREPSHVLKAMGLSDDVANSTIRFSFSHNNTREDIDYTISVLSMAVAQLRSINKEWRKLHGDI